MTGRINRLAALLLGLAGLLPAYIYHGIAVPPGGQHAWVVKSKPPEVYRTSDFGNTWIRESLYTMRDFSDVVFADTLNGWTCGRAGDIWGTSDGGNSWRRQNLGGPKWAFRVRLVDDSTGWVAGQDAIALHTTDRGEEWQAVFFDSIVPQCSVDFQGLHFACAESGWMAAGRLPQDDTFDVGQGYIVRTTNAGTSWELVYRDTALDFYDIGFVDNVTGCVVGGYERTMHGAILRTTDAGLHWTPCSMPPSPCFLRSVKFVGPRHGWACGEYRAILRTTDAGLTWERQYSMADSTLFDIDFADTLRGMIAGAHGVFRTTDGGIGWEQTTIGIAEQPTDGQERAPALRLLTNPTRAGPVFEVAGIGLPCLLAVYDPSGRLVMSAPVSGPHVSLPARLRPGVYCARLLTSGTVATASLVVLE